MQLSLESKASFKFTPTEGYFYYQPLDLYVPEEHRTLIHQVEAELNNKRYTHDTEYAYKRGCKGPLCKRASRLRRRPNPTRSSHKSVEPLLFALTAASKNQDIKQAIRTMHPSSMR